MTEPSLDERRRAIHARFEDALEAALMGLRELDLADPDVDDYPAGILTSWAVVYERRVYLSGEELGRTQHAALAREDQSQLMTAALGRWLMIDREMELHGGNADDD